LWFSFFFRINSFNSHLDFIKMQENLTLWTCLLPAVTFGFAAAVQPGPLSLYLISQTLQNGWKKTLPAVFSPLITDGPIALLCLFILSRFPPHFLQYLQLAGGLFITYLAFRALKAWKNYNVPLVAPATSSRWTLANSVVVNFLNPGPYLGWSLIIGPLFFSVWQKNPVTGFAVLAAFYLTMFCISIAMMLLFSLARQRGAGLQRTLIGLSALFLFIFGCYEFYSGITALVRMNAAAIR
jgi:threonine/homoserine/homoserine lactone efflux protein